MSIEKVIQPGINKLRLRSFRSDNITSLTNSHGQVIVKSLGKNLTIESYLTNFTGTRFINPESDLPFLNHKLQGADYYFFENQVKGSNWKPILLIQHDGKLYVPRRVKNDYCNDYDKCREAELRPNVKWLSFPDNFTHKLGLFEFAGSETVDFSNIEDMRQICSLGIAMTNKLTSFDPNQGNLVINEEEKLVYIDKDLIYINFDNTSDALICNIAQTLHKIKTSFESLDGDRKLMFFVIDQYANKVNDLIDQKALSIQALNKRELDEKIDLRLTFLSAEYRRTLGSSGEELYAELVKTIKEKIFCVEP